MLPASARPGHLPRAARDARPARRRAARRTSRSRCTSSPTRSPSAAWSCSSPTCSTIRTRSIRGLKHFQFRGTDVIVFHVLDPDEIEFPFERRDAVRGSRDRRGGDGGAGAGARALPEGDGRADRALPARARRVRASTTSSSNTDEPLEMALLAYLSTQVTVGTGLDVLSFLSPRCFSPGGCRRRADRAAPAQARAGGAGEVRGGAGCSSRRRSSTPSSGACASCCCWRCAWRALVLLALAFARPFFASGAGARIDRRHRRRARYLATACRRRAVRARAGSWRRTRSRRRRPAIWSASSRSPTRRTSWSRRPPTARSRPRRSTAAAGLRRARATAAALAAARAQRSTAGAARSSSSPICRRAAGTPAIARRCPDGRASRSPTSAASPPNLAVDCRPARRRPRRRDGSQRRRARRATRASQLRARRPRRRATRRHAFRAEQLGRRRARPRGPRGDAPPCRWTIARGCRPTTCASRCSTAAPIASVLVVTANGDLGRDAFYVQQALTAAGGAGARVRRDGRERRVALRVERGAPLVGGRGDRCCRRRGSSGAGARRWRRMSGRGGGLLVAAGPDVDGAVAGDVLGAGAPLRIAAVDRRTARGARPGAGRRAASGVPGVRGRRRDARARDVSARRADRRAACQTIARFTTGEAALVECGAGDGRGARLRVGSEQPLERLPAARDVRAVPARDGRGTCRARAPRRATISSATCRPACRPRPASRRCRRGRRGARGESP